MAERPELSEADIEGIVDDDGAVELRRHLVSEMPGLIPVSIEVKIPELTNTLARVLVMCPGSRIENMMEMFNLFDKDHSGTIDKSEMKKVAQALGWGLTDEEIEKQVLIFDSNKDEVLDKEEYLALLKSLQKDPEEAKLELRQAFLYFDREKSGKLSLERLRQVLAATGVIFLQRDTTALKQMFSEIDKNGDGNISVDEYVDFMMDKKKLSELQQKSQQLRF